MSNYGALWQHMDMYFDNEASIALGVAFLPGAELGNDTNRRA